MKHFVTVGGLAAALLATSATAADPRDAPVVVNVDGLRYSVAVKVIEHAQKGQRSLARYLESVRPYQHLALEDVMRPKAAPRPALAAPQQAQAGASQQPG